MRAVSLPSWLQPRHTISRPLIRSLRCDTLPSLLPPQTATDIHSLTSPRLNNEPSFSLLLLHPLLSGPFHKKTKKKRFSSTGSRHQLNIRLFGPPSHVPCLGNDCHTCGFEQVVEAEGADDDADEDYCDGDVVVHGWLVGIVAD